MLLCVCAALMMIDFYRESRVERALTEIQTVGGLYMRAEGGRSRPVIGIDLDATIVYDNQEVRLRGPVTDKTLLVVAEFGGLHELSLVGADVSDSGLASVKGLKALRRLNLSRTQLTDTGLSNLRAWQTCGSSTCVVRRSPPKVSRSSNSPCPKRQSSPTRQINDALPNDGHIRVCRKLEATR